ncbi:AcrR family transcriptional regulator [Microbacterium trichothecenolyticum]|uniref:TetR/AcrR family transcriptional regulator n=1 Tax=Microbacterium trichothecenolyticum TaxID=69370 RepID=UPI00285DA0B0|nr:TetR family transcriptional regulator [Microbacterium trichothecenolyticum]MDR7186827.1 AcrR family transcriptional regulator [Microbacterium trichothecenolyticum]
MCPPYVSPLREAQAAQTRRRILDAAANAFRTSGYAGTSLSQIAGDAGVSLETVKQNGPKAALLLAAFDYAFTGTEDDSPLHQRASLEGIRNLPDEELLLGLVTFIAQANSRVATLWPRLLEASLADAGVGRRITALQQNRRLDMEEAIALLRHRGLCQSPRPDSELAGALSFLISPESYHQLVLDADWSSNAYRDWLVEAVERLILT